MYQGAWLPVLLFFLIVTTILVALRLYVDVSKYLKSGYLATSVISLAFAVGAYLFFVVACAMVIWREKRRMANMGIDPGRGPWIPPIGSLGPPVREATIMHSYVVPTGLWLCKASFVAMCKSACAAW